MTVTVDVSVIVDVILRPDFVRVTKTDVVTGEHVEDLAHRPKRALVGLLVVEVTAAYSGTWSSGISKAEVKERIAAKMTAKKERTNIAVQSERRMLLRKQWMVNETVST